MALDPSNSSSLEQLALKGSLDITPLTEIQRKLSTAIDLLCMLQLKLRIYTMYDWPNLRGTQPLPPFQLVQHQKVIVRLFAASAARGLDYMRLVFQQTDLSL